MEETSIWKQKNGRASNNTTADYKPLVACKNKTLKYFKSLKNNFISFYDGTI